MNSSLLTDPPFAADCAMRVAKSMMRHEGTAGAWALELEAADIGYAGVAMRLTPAMLKGVQLAKRPHRRAGG